MTVQAEAITMAGDVTEDASMAVNSGGWLDLIKRKNKLIVVGVGVLALLGAGGIGAMRYFSHDAEEVEEAVAPAHAITAAGPDSFVEAPPMVVNLRSADGQARYLKLRFIVVAGGPEFTDEVRGRLPLILDALQPFLRELRPEDLNGSAAVFRVKEEMMRRAADAMGAGVVRDILIQDLVQQ